MIVYVSGLSGFKVVFCSPPPSCLLRLINQQCYSNNIPLPPLSVHKHVHVLPDQQHLRAPVLEQRLRLSGQPAAVVRHRPVLRHGHQRVGVGRCGECCDPHVHQRVSPHLTLFVPHPDAVSRTMPSS